MHAEMMQSSDEEYETADQYVYEPPNIPPPADPPSLYQGEPLETESPPAHHERPLRPKHNTSDSIYTIRHGREHDRVFFQLRHRRYTRRVGEIDELWGILLPGEDARRIGLDSFRGEVAVGTPCVLVPEYNITPFNQHAYGVPYCRFTWVTLDAGSVFERRYQASVLP